MTLQRWCNRYVNSVIHTHTYTHTHTHTHTYTYTYIYIHNNMHTYIQEKVVLAGELEWLEGLINEAEKVLSLLVLLVQKYKY